MKINEYLPMELKERDYWLGFNIFPGIGSKRFFHLLAFFGSAKKAWLAKEKELNKTSLPEKIIGSFLDFRGQIDLSNEIVKLQKRRIRFLILQDDEYPKNLKKIPSPPPVIYIKGRLLPEDEFSIAVIGSRKITPYGREVAEKMTAGLAGYNYTIVSGLARGIDAVAHRTALACKARTIAVLGSGLDNIYPPEHRNLAEKICAADSGALISELGLGVKSLPGHFPLRNRIISGLALGVVVCEAALESGTKITSQYCLKQGRKLFAVPGPITSSLSEGPLDLIKKGANLAASAEDVVKVIGRKNYFRPGKARLKQTINFSHPDEEKIFQLLLEGGKHIDEIVKKAGFTSSQALSYLTALELQGMVKNIGQGNYILA